MKEIVGGYRSAVKRPRRKF